MIAPAIKNQRRRSSSLQNEPVAASHVKLKNSVAKTAPLLKSLYS